MRLNWEILVAAFIGSCFAGITPARARDVPIEIRWQDIEPNTISVVSPDGSKLLEKKTAQKQFVGTLSVSDELVTPEYLQVEYSSYTIPLKLNVRKGAPAITFLVDRYKVPACANLYVGQVEQAADTMDEAMRRMVTAAYMLSLPPPDRECRGSLKPRTVKARIDRNVNLASRSLGLFDLTDDVRNAVLATPPAALPGSLAPEVVIANADDQAKGALAKGLYTDMLESSSKKDFATAAELGNDMSKAVKTDDKLAAAFQSQGITEGRLLADTSYLNSRASNRF